MSYQLIAFDMDDTLLDDRQEISAYTMNRIAEAYERGKTVILSTGRALPELRHYFNTIPHLRYAICVSGAIVYDIPENKVLFSDPIPPAGVQGILDAARGEDLAVHFLSVESILEEDKLQRLDYYCMGRHREVFNRVITRVENIFDYFARNPRPVEKVNLFCPTPELRIRMSEKLNGSGLAQTFGEGNILELTAGHVSKALGLTMLCRHLGIDPAETIAVGDGDNDLEILKTAGFAVAMGNANEHVKAIADAVVADNNHDGCAEAIERFLF